MNGSPSLKPSSVNAPRSDRGWLSFADKRPFWLRQLQGFAEAFTSFFPVHLTLLQLRKNLSLMAFWVALFGFVGGWFGKRLGVPYLFLSPEYLNAVDFRSFFIVGLALSTFVMAYQMTAYILDAYRFNFLGALPRPFLIFYLNNSVIPLAFVGFYVVCVLRFQVFLEGKGWGEAALNVAGFYAGMAVMRWLPLLYFRAMNRDALQRFTDKVDKKLKKNVLQRVNVMERLTKARRGGSPVSRFVDYPLAVREVDRDAPYDKEAILHVFDQNQFNSFLLQSGLFLSILLLGLLRDVPFVQIPAAASVLLLFSMLLMAAGAVAYWLKSWSVSVVLAVALIVNPLASRQRQDPYHKAFGLSYETRARYDDARLRALSSQGNYVADSLATIRILENWRAKFPAGEKPKMLFLCASGGGLRAALWTARTLQYLDSLHEGRVSRQAMLMTGASGGLIGAAYYRELLLRKNLGEDVDPLDRRHLESVAKDKLNPTVFSLVVGDLFFRFQTFDLDGRRYYKDRGYALERQWLVDTDSLFDKPMCAYREPEAASLVPMMLISPSVVNDGRKLYISPQPCSYLTVTQPESATASPQASGIEARRFFAEQNADSLRFATALRLNATYPYITPNVLLPSEPFMEVMDAGLADNYGAADAVKFLHCFREWVAANTSGAVFVFVRDSPKEPAILQKTKKSPIARAFTPIGDLVRNLVLIQDMRNDMDLEYARSWFDGPLDAVYFQYQDGSDREGASLSWRLTAREKADVNSAIEKPYNAAALEKLARLLGEQ